MDLQESNLTLISHESSNGLPSLKGHIEHLIFVDCLQRFAQRIKHLYDLETQGEIEPEKTRECIRFSLDQLHRAKQDLGILEQPAA